MFGDEPVQWYIVNRWLFSITFVRDEHRTAIQELDFQLYLTKYDRNQEIAIPSFSFSVSAKQTCVPCRCSTVDNLTLDNKVSTQTGRHWEAGRPGHSSREVPVSPLREVRWYLKGWSPCSRGRLGNVRSPELRGGSVAVHFRAVLKPHFNQLFAAKTLSNLSPFTHTQTHTRQDI